MNRVFSKSLKILIVSMLLLAVLFPKNISQKLMLASILIWLLVLAAGSFTKGILSIFKCRPLSRFYRSIFLPARERIKRFFRVLCRPEASGFVGERAPAGLSLQEESNSQLFVPEQNLRNDPAILQSDASIAALQQSCGRQEKENELMLRHIALRITEKLKSAYPQAVWQWRDKPVLSSILAGNTIRICVENMAQYTHADIFFDRFGRIHIEPMVVGEFLPQEKKDSSSEGEGSGEPPVIDVRVWYELIGQKVLEEQITDLNANGHSRLSVKENGDIVIMRQKKEVFRAHLESFPEKSHWQELLAVLSEDELKGRIAGNQLQISWV